MFTLPRHEGAGIKMITMDEEDGDPDLDPRDRAYDCKEHEAIVKRSKPG